jgi:hypothetical protein
MPVREYVLLCFGLAAGWIFGFQSSLLCTSCEGAERKIDDLKRQIVSLSKPPATAAASTTKPTSVTTRVLPLQTKPSFCGPAVSDNEKWKAERADMLKRKQFGGSGEGQGHWKKAVYPTYFCDKLHYNLDQWVKPKLHPKDLVIGVFTGETLFYGRTSALRDTWLLHFPHHYIFSAHSEERIPVTGLAAKYSKKYPSYTTDHEGSMNAQWSQLLGLKEMVLNSPHQKWYYIVGCDNYVHPDYVLRMLEMYDATKPIVVAQYGEPEPLPPQVFTLVYTDPSLIPGRHSAQCTANSQSTVHSIVAV